MTEEQVAFDNLRTAFNETLQLHRPDYSQPFILQTEANSIGMAYCLYQEDSKGQREVISYACTKFFAAEKLVSYGQSYDSYLIPRSREISILRTDNRALTWLYRTTEGFS